MEWNGTDESDMMDCEKEFETYPSGTICFKILLYLLENTFLKGLTHFEQEHASPVHFEMFLLKIFV